MEDLKMLFVESAKRLCIDFLTEQQIQSIWQLFVDQHNEYIPDNFCYCFTDYALNILSQHYEESVINALIRTAKTLTLADVIYSLCIQGVNREVANTLANTWIKQCHRIYIRIDEELKDIPKRIWHWIFDDREYLYKRLQSLRICFIGKGDELFSRVNNKNKENTL